MTAAGPDADRLRTELGQVIDRASVGGRGVRSYCEMVALLWDAGSLAAAIELEDRWSDLAGAREFALLCG